MSVPVNLYRHLEVPVTGTYPKVPVPVRVTGTKNLVPVPVPISALAIRGMVTRKKNFLPHKT